MKLVADNNVLFSIMNPKSASSYLFSSIRAKFSAPEFIRSELNEHKEECLFKSKLSEHEFEMMQAEVEENIKFFEPAKYDVFLKIALNELSDLDDADFLALALSIKAAIWSNDPHLKQQSLVKVYTTAELIDKLLRGEI